MSSASGTTHWNGRKYDYPDALAPVRLPYRSRLPEPDNRISGQKAQAFWVDVWIPADARSGDYPLRFRLTSGEGEARAAVSVRVLRSDGSGLGCGGDRSQLLRQFLDRRSVREARARAGKDFYRSDSFFRLIHAYHRIFYEHRGVFHQLGYGHAGKVGPEFAPALEGSGRSKHVADWDLFDRHYGPLVRRLRIRRDPARRAANSLCLPPINPEWPASYLWWGSPAMRPNS